MDKLYLGSCEVCRNTIEVDMAEVYMELDEEQEIWLASKLLEEEDKYEGVSDIISNEEFNANLDALKGVYYRLSTEEEDMLNKLFEKYL